MIDRIESGLAGKDTHWVIFSAYWFSHNKYVGPDTCECDMARSI